MSKKLRELLIKFTFKNKKINGFNIKIYMSKVSFSKF